MATKDEKDRQDREAEADKRRDDRHDRSRDYDRQKEADKKADDRGWSRPSDKEDKWGKRD